MRNIGLAELLIVAAKKDQDLRFGSMWLRYGMSNTIERLEEIYRRKLDKLTHSISPIDIYMNDCFNAILLFTIIQCLGSWPHSKILSEEASLAAWIIAQHADPTPSLQEFFLTKLIEVTDENDEYLQLLVNRVAMNKSSSPKVSG